MKIHIKLIVTFFLFLFHLNCISQDRSLIQFQRLLILDEIMREKRMSNMQAQEYIFGTRDYYLSIIINNSSNLESGDYKRLLNLEELMWNKVNVILELYGSNYSKFLNEYSQLIYDYKSIMDKRIKEKLPEKPSCDLVMTYVKHRMKFEKMLDDDILDSSWLKSVKMYKSDLLEIYVIAEIYSSNSVKEYVFCSVSEEQWNSFLLNKNSSKFGDRFWAYIKPNKCDCN